MDSLCSCLICNFINFSVPYVLLTVKTVENHQLTQKKKNKKKLEISFRFAWKNIYINCNVAMLVKKLPQVLELYANQCYC